MGTTRVYDSLVWLRKIKDAGIKEFKHAELAAHGLTNKPCLMQARKKGFIKRIAKDNKNHCITWVINETAIKESTKRKVYFGE